MYSPPVWADSEIALSWSSTLPEELNQERPLWANEGQAWTKTVTISASSSATTPQTSAPSIRSTRWSDHFGPYSWVSSSSNVLLLVERRDPAGLGDHRSGERTTPRPVDEFEQRFRARASVAREDEEEVARERVFQRLDADLARRAGDAVDLEGLEALLLPGETGVADCVRVLFDRVDDEAVGGQSVDVGRRRFVVQHRLEEEVVGPSVGVAADRVDRGGQVRAADLTPVGQQAAVDVMGLLDRDVADAVLRVDVEAGPVEEHLDVGRPRVAGERGTGLPGELAGPVLDVFDAGVAAVGGVDEVNLVVDLLRVGGEEGLQHRLRGHGAGPDQGHGAGRRRRSEPQKGDRRYGEGLDSHCWIKSFPAGYLSLTALC